MNSDLSGGYTFWTTGAWCSFVCTGLFTLALLACSRSDVARRKLWSELSCTPERESVRTLSPFPPLVSPRSCFLREFFSRALVWLLSERLEQARARLTGLARFPRSHLTSKSFVKFLMSSCERAGWLGSRDLGFSNRDLGKRDAADGIALHSLSSLLKNIL